jgi:hypothetical protein
MTYEAKSNEDLWTLSHDEVQYEDWPSLARALSRPSPGWIFRGMAHADWLLEANLARVLDENPAWPPDEWEMAERSAIGFFKQHARATLPDPCGTTEHLRGSWTGPHLHSLPVTSRSTGVTETPMRCCGRSKPFTAVG